jgi:hypothetical protein
MSSTESKPQKRKREENDLAVKEIHAMIRVLIDKVHDEVGVLESKLRKVIKDKDASRDSNDVKRFFDQQLERHAERVAKLKDDPDVWESESLGSDSGSDASDDDDGDASVADDEGEDGDE